MSEIEELAEINAALNAINATCLELQYDDRGRFGAETIEPLRNVARLINKLVSQRQNLLTVLEIAQAFAKSVVQHGAEDGDESALQLQALARSAISSATQAPPPAETGGVE
ncbi:hypothetical protein [Rhizobium sp. 2MFCol3.1]|uniref:hypothetical protein n=1 Tax=Rhizobium sp. 2MFCol3.1 TaxID=1246459 RepID=UPI00036C35BA|nr:hypothetical protein [Rhizobium sp. 2MFCol3.1]